MSYLPIEGHQTLSRDLRSYGLVVTDSNAITQAKAQKQRILDLQKEVQDLRRDLDSIKLMLQTLISK